MAKRSIGDVKIELYYQDGPDNYRCRVKCDKGYSIVFVKPPRLLMVPVDAPAAYDEAAVAALKAAMDPPANIKGLAEPIADAAASGIIDGNYVVRRKN